MFRTTYNPQKNNSVHVFVDGSHNPQRGLGFGFVAMDSAGTTILHQESVPILNGAYQNTTNCGAEILAAIRAILWAEKSGYKHITIVHDYIGIRTLALHKRPGHRSPLFNLYKEIVQPRMQYQKNHTKVFLRKVTSHTGNFGNEIADKLARNAMIKAHRMENESSWLNLLQRWYYLYQLSLPKLYLQNKLQTWLQHA
jgi:ribonuclease HI